MKQLVAIIGILLSFTANAQGSLVFYYRCSVPNDSIVVFNLTHYVSDSIPSYFPWIYINYGDATGDLIEMKDSTIKDGVVIRNFYSDHQYRTPLTIDHNWTTTFHDTAHRVKGITNIPNSEEAVTSLNSTFLHLKGSQIKNKNISSVVFDFPLHLIKTGKTFTYEPHATDDDGDSLSYALVPCRVPDYYLPANSSINPITGAFTFSPDTPGIYAFNIEITERRKDSNGFYGFIASSELDFIVEDPMTTGIDEFQHDMSDLTIYPNPVSNELNISSNDISDNLNASIEIFNSLGQTVYHSTYSDKINVTELPNGMYNFVLFRNNHTIESLRFIKD